MHEVRHLPLGAQHGDGRQRVIAVAPTGGRRSRAEHPALPITAAEIAETARACLAAGAAMLHLHVRDPAGAHSLDVEAYRAAMTAVRRACGVDLVIQITTESLGRFDPPAQLEVVRSVRPDAASLAYRELCRTEQDADALAELARWAAGEGLRLQLIAYDTADLDGISAWADRHSIALGHISLLCVLGRYTAAADGLTQLLAYAAHRLPATMDVMVCAFGREEIGAVVAAAVLGAHVRVGFENNLLRPDGQPLADNAHSVARVRAALEAVGLEPADARALRRLWGIAR